MSWGDDVRALADEVTTNPRCAAFDVEVGAPADDAEVELVHRRLGFELDPRFLAYFRACNGLKLRWVQPLGDEERGDPGAFLRHVDDRMDCGSIRVPPLRELFPEAMDHRFNRRDDYTPNAETTPFLGGWCVGALRNALRPLDDYLWRPGDASFYNVALVADARSPDPVCVLTEDYAAALGEHRPMRARAYLDLVVATCGLVRARLDVMGHRGAAEDPPVVERVERPTREPREFLRHLLDQLPLERGREVGAAYERMVAASR